MANKKQTRANLVKGFFIENPLFVSVLGTCPSLATTKSLEGAIGMGILFTIVLICSNVLISLVRKLIPDEVRTPCYIVIIAGFVTMVKMLCQAFLPALYSTLGVFISLIVVNCIVLGRAEAYASKHGPFDSFIDAIGMGIGYMLALISIALFREILGTGYLTFGKIFTFIPLTQIPILTSEYAIKLFTMPAGGFIVFACILAAIAAISNNRKKHKLVDERIAKAKLLAEQKAKEGEVK